MRNGSLTTVALIVVASAFFGGWALIYPSPDPRSLSYVSWKAGFHSMDLDLAAQTMIGDPSREKLVVGKTVSELQERFGTLREASEASEYLRNCYQNSPWKDNKVLFIRKTAWMVIFEGERATDLVLIKGC